MRLYFTSAARALLTAGLALMALQAPARAATVTINFDAGTALGAEATNLYVAQGVRFPSRPIIAAFFGNQLLQQGEERTCGPLIVEMSAPMGVREVRLRVLNRHLRSYSVAAYAGALQVDLNEFSARPPSFLEPLPPMSRDIVLRAGADEGDITRIVATPSADCFDHMTIDDLVLTTARDIVPIDPVPPPVPPNVVSVLAYEMSQGVMSRLTRPGRSIDTRPDTRLQGLPSKRLSFVAGRNLAVRFFLGASERDIADFNSELLIVVTDRDGTARTRTITENTAGGRSVPRTRATTPLAQQRELVLRRAQVDSSLDYVIPGTFLANARSMRLNLRGSARYGILHQINVSFKGPYRMGVNLFRVRDPGAGPTPTMITGQRLVRYLEDIFPVSGNIRLRHGGTLPVDSTAATDCSTMLGNLHAAAAGTTAGTAILNVNYWSNLFIARNPPGCLGYGWYNTPGALSNLSPSTAGQEIGHNIGMNHVSSGHGESAGGTLGDWEAWPYLHGAIGVVDEASGFNDGAFGLIMRRNGPPPRTPDDFGTWTLSPIAPCQTSTDTLLFPRCAVSDSNVVHDLMSYGPAPALPVWGNELWISDINFYRLQQWFDRCIALDPAHRFFTGSSASFNDPVGACTPAGIRVLPPATTAAAAATNPREILLVSGRIGSDGALAALQFVRKLTTAQLPLTPPGPHALVLRNANGQQVRIPFAEQRGSGHVPDVRQFAVIAPFDPALRQAVIELNGKAVRTLERSGPAPAIALLAPQAGELWRSPLARIGWSLTGLAPQALVYAQYSPDNGASWIPLGLVPAWRNYLELDMHDLQPSKQALIYLSVSEGLRSATALSKPFVIGNVAAPAPPAGDGAAGR
ncbi:hypothetical protein F2P45_00015 [Massilia sp. CCM 8733]|uniref:Uncharacterized protein n=1 Tax=Massilia mucilaginosa TaxID=2609282 RepID=A0ABX0NKV7_9BURK|nr:hypothetical protein [Massilia mucilaginosa]NHZ87426.1 hypothetical protein [Massilia mucilaginosa]